MKGIPENILKEHILKAMVVIDRDGIRPGRNSTKHEVLYDKKRYPPKYLISLANVYPNKEELDPNPSWDARKARNFLKTMKFTIVPR